MPAARSVLGEELKTCSIRQVTAFYGTDCWKPARQRFPLNQWSSGNGVPATAIPACGPARPNPGPTPMPGDAP